MFSSPMEKSSGIAFRRNGPRNQCKLIGSGSSLRRHPRLPSRGRLAFNPRPWGSPPRSECTRLSASSPPRPRPGPGPQPRSGRAPPELSPAGPAAPQPPHGSPLRQVQPDGVGQVFRSPRERGVLSRPWDPSPGRELPGSWGEKPKSPGPTVFTPRPGRTLGVPGQAAPPRLSPGQTGGEGTRRETPVPSAAPEREDNGPRARSFPARGSTPPNGAGRMRTAARPRRPRGEGRTPGSAGRGARGH
ncbi:translation initiation factor IF-2-like [Perognathus longimembris pacificus]|uniref:translation initiation factor IF-2-like n=1 Tax=Perognathus longimembris pacificus TaxID=214514 RepID=UPI0020192A83|nr:translation initiation factor IF-2-like [Perognathus longimembris pacificus]